MRREYGAPLIESIEFDAAGGCWEWRAARNNDGYGVKRFGGHVRRIHRVVFEMFCGPIPAEMTLDHLCRNRACCNPKHLEVVTRGENVRRGHRWIRQDVA